MPPDDYRYCHIERDGHVVPITLNRPDVLNAMHPAGHAELARAFDAYADDPDLRVAIVTGAGERAFCVGTDLKAHWRRPATTASPPPASPASRIASIYGSR